MIRVYKSITLKPNGKNEVRFVPGEYGDDIPDSWKTALEEAGALDDPEDTAAAAKEKADARRKERADKAAAAEAALAKSRELKARAHLVDEPEETEE